MASAEELTKQDAVSITELYEEVSRETGVHIATVRARLQGPLDKAAWMLIDRELMVLPDGWKIRGMVHREVVLASIAYMYFKLVPSSRWLRQQFFADFFDGEHYAVDQLPKRLQREARRKPGRRPKSVVTPISSARRSTPHRKAS